MPGKRMFTADRLYALHEELLAFLDEYGSDVVAAGAAAQVVGEVADRERALEHPEEHVEEVYFGRAS